MYPELPQNLTTAAAVYLLQFRFSASRFFEIPFLSEHRYTCLWSLSGGVGPPRFQVLSKVLQHDAAEVALKLQDNILRIWSCVRTVASAAVISSMVLCRA